jgi:type I restriction enzyme, S subunit
MQREPGQRMLRWAHLPECEAPPRGWHVETLTDIVTVIAGQSPPSETYNDKTDGLPFLQGNGDFSSVSPVPRLWCTAPAKVAKRGDSLISVRAPVGELNRADQDYAIGRGLAAIRAKGGCDADFLHHALQRWRWCLQRVAQGTTFDAVTARHFSQLSVCVPRDPDEQTAIAHILNAVDTALERSRAAVERARELDRSILEDAFANLNAPCLELRGLISDVRYGTSKASSDRGWGNPVLRIPNVVGDRLALADLAYVDLPPADVERLRLSDGDLLLVRTNGNPHYVGRSVVFRSPDERTWVYASYLIRVRLKSELLPEFVNVYLGLERGRRELLRRVTTSAGNHNINSNSIRLLRLPVPSDEDAQTRIVDLSRASRHHIDALLTRVTALERLKKSLMHDLLTGRKRVTNPANVAAS